MTYDRFIKKILSTLAQARKEQRLTLREVSERLKRPSQSINRWENQRSKNMQLQTLWEYAKALGYELEILLKKK